MLRHIVALTLLAFLVAASATAGPIHTAAGAGNVARVKSLLAANSRAINEADPHGATALHWAVDKDKRAVAELLVARGANVNAAKKDGVRPLHVAAAFGRLGMVRFLVERGADPGRIDARGRTALSIAESTGYRDVAAYLRSEGASKPSKPAVPGGQVAAEPVAGMPGEPSFGAPDAGTMPPPPPVEPEPVADGLFSGNTRYLLIAAVAVLFLAVILVFKKVVGGREPEVAEITLPTPGTSEPQPVEPVGPVAFDLETPAPPSAEPPPEPAAPSAPAFDLPAEPSFEIPAAPAFDLGTEEANAPDEAPEEPTEGPVEPAEKLSEAVFDLSEEPPKAEDEDK